jgi:hypothetical protein
VSPINAGHVHVLFNVDTASHPHTSPSPTYSCNNPSSPIADSRNEEEELMAMEEKCLQWPGCPVLVGGLPSWIIAAPRNCTDASVEVSHYFWDANHSIDTHLPGGWHLNRANVPMSPMPREGLGRHLEIHRLYCYWTSSTTFPTAPTQPSGIGARDGAWHVVHHILPGRCATAPEEQDHGEH